MKKFLSLVLASVTALTVAAPPATAALTNNGLHVNALTNNGTRLNALSNNGTRLNALSNNGTRLNALSNNGTSLSGAVAGTAEPIAVVPAIRSVRLADGTIVTVR